MVQKQQRMSRRLEGCRVNGVWNCGFEPVINEDSVILILGSFPSVKSRENGFYYGNPQNRFWKTLSKALKKDIPSDTEGKKAFLYANGIALWDVYEQASIKGSADADINEATGKTGNVRKLAEKFSNVKIALCNGKKAFAVASRELDGVIPCVCLSSTSSANPRFDEKEWIEVLRKFLQIKE